MTRTVRIGVTTTAALTVVGATEVLLFLALAAQWRIVASPAPASLDEALTLVVLTVAVALGGWLAFSTAGALLAHLPGRLGALADRWARAWAPACSRRVAALLVGAAVGGALAPGTALGGASTDVGSGPGFASTAPSPGFTVTLPTLASSTTPADTTSAATSAPAPGWTPSRPLQRPQPSAGLLTGAGVPAPAADVVVHRGDTLWDIARRHLGPGASDAEVAEAWPAWHHANRAVVGDDPGVILPGQVLHPPAVAAAGQPSGARR